MAYDFEGHLLEVCTSKAIRPCWVGEEPDGGQCEGLPAQSWRLRRTILGVAIWRCLWAARCSPPPA